MLLRERQAGKGRGNTERGSGLKQVAAIHSVSLVGFGTAPRAFDCASVEQGRRLANPREYEQRTAGQTLS